MVNKIKKIFTLLVNIYKTFFINLRYFSFKLAVNSLILPFMRGPFYNKKIILKLINSNHVNIEKYLIKNYSKELGLLNDNSITDNKHKLNLNPSVKINSTIWVCWFQGEENAPDLVKKCIASIRRNAGNHEVIIITYDNYEEYVKIPKYIVDRVEKKEIQLAIFSDLLRYKLLDLYGGLWIDSTVFVKNKIDDDIFKMNFYSIKAQKTDKYSDYYISYRRWATFVVQSKQNNILFQYYKSIYYEYWKKEKYLIDYLFADYIFDIEYNNNSKIKKMIDDVPINNLDVDKYASLMSKEYSKEKFDELMSSDTNLFKLSYREKYKLKTDEGKDTFYKHFLDTL